MTSTYTHLSRSWDQHMDPAHLRDMARHVWGEESQAMMRSFRPSDSVLMRYEQNILECDRAIRGHRVMDLGCNHGLWSYCAMRHGASHVLGVEPRGMFVRGLNSFAQQHSLPMQFQRGHDTDVARLIREHDIDTVMLMSVDDITQWESMMWDIRRSGVTWVIMQNSAVPDAWLQFDREVYDHAESSGLGMPVGFTLHYESHNSDTRSGINPLHKDLADPDTGYQHLDHDGALDLQSSRVFLSKKSLAYIRRFIDHAGFTIERSLSQSQAVRASGGDPSRNTKGASASHSMYQWYLLRNDK